MKFEFAPSWFAACCAIIFAVAAGYDGFEYAYRALFVTPVPDPILSPTPPRLFVIAIATGVGICNVPLLNELTVVIAGCEEVG